MQTALAAVVQQGPEQRYTLCIAYPAMRKDLHGEFMTPENLEQVAFDFLAKYREIGIYHEDGTLGHGTLVESYIWRAPAWTLTAVDGTQVTVNPGDWLIGVIWDEAAWELWKSGWLDGVSIDGRAFRRRGRIPAANAA